MKLRTVLLPLIALAALLIAAPAAQAKPSKKDARQAAGNARQAVADSVDAAASGDIAGAADKIAAAGKLQAKAARLARRAGAGRRIAAQANLLSGAAANVDDAFGIYAQLIAQAPPELQPYLLEALTKLEALRADLVSQLTGFLETLPADVREQILATIAAFEADGDLQALIEALSGGDLAAAVQTGLSELVAQLTATIGSHLGDLGDLEQVLPPGAIAQLQAAMAQINTQLETALAQLSQLFGQGGSLPGGGGLPPIGIPGNLCEQLGGLFGGFGFPLPPALCD